MLRETIGFFLLLYLVLLFLCLAGGVAGDNETDGPDHVQQAAEGQGHPIPILQQEQIDVQ